MSCANYHVNPKNEEPSLNTTPHPNKLNANQNIDYNVHRNHYSKEKKKN